MYRWVDEVRAREGRWDRQLEEEVEKERREEQRKLAALAKKEAEHTEVAEQKRREREFIEEENATVAEKLAVEQDLREWVLEREFMEEGKQRRRAAKRRKVPTSATGADEEAATTGEGGASGANGPADEHSNAESTPGDGTTTQVGASPAGVGELVDVPELSDEALRISGRMFESTPSQTPATAPAMLGIL